MIPRLITALIFVFCGVMTTLLVRSVMYPKNSGLAVVSPRIAFDHFASRNGGSDLDVWEGNNIIGSCQIRPDGSVMAIGDGTAAVKVNITVLIRLQQPILESQTIKLTGDLMLHSNGELDDLELELSLPGSLPRVSLAIEQPAGQASPSLTLKRAKEVIYSNAPGTKQDGFMALMVENMLKSSGLSLETLGESSDRKEQHAPEVRTGLFESGGETIDGFLLTNGADAATNFDLYMDKTGEILRIDTPLTGENQLGLRFLAESRRPAGVAMPDLDEFHFLKSLLKKKK